MAVRRIALAAGFTAGHVFPMLAVAEAFRLRHPDAVILAIGGHDGPEAALIRDSLCDFRAISGAPLHGLATWRDRLRALPALCLGFFQARRLLRETGCEIVIGFGAYISVGTLMAACSLGIPAAIFEPNAVPGLANRLLARLVDLKLVVSPAVTARPEFADGCLVDYPLRPVIAALSDRAVDVSQSNRQIHVLVTGGSRGSNFLNRAAPELLAKLAARGFVVTVHHQAGDDETGPVAADYARLKLPAVVTGFIAEMAEAYAQADLVICAAGAGTLAEVGHLALPALIVPIEKLADEHQIANAAAFSVTPHTLVRREGGWQADVLADDVASLLRARPFMPVRYSSGSFDIVALCGQLLAEHPTSRRKTAVTASPSESAKS